MHAAAVIGETLDGLRSIVGMGAPPRGPFDVRVGPNRRFATAEVPFALLRDVKRALGGTINDAVLAGVGGGLHDLLDARGEQTRGRTLRVMVPVSVRSKAEQGDVGNRVAPAFVDIPVGALKPATRLRRVRAATDAAQGVGDGGERRLDHRARCLRATRRSTPWQPGSFRGTDGSISSCPTSRRRRCRCIWPARN